MEMQRLLQKLETTEKVILGMLSRKLPDDLIDQRLSFVVQLISQIPTEETELSHLWNDRLVALWTIQSENSASHHSKPIDAASVVQHVNQGTLSANKPLVSPPIHQEVSNLQKISTGGDEISRQNLNNCLISFSELSCSTQEPPQVDPTLEEELTQLEKAIESTFANDPPSRSKLEGQIAEFMSLVSEIPRKCKGQIKKWAGKSDFIVKRCISLPMQSPTTCNVAFCEEESTKLKQQAFAVEKLLQNRPLRKDAIERILVEMVKAVEALPDDQMQIKETCREMTTQLISSYEQLDHQEDAKPREATSAPGVDEGLSSQEKSAKCTPPLPIEAPKCSQYSIESIWKTLAGAFRGAESSLSMWSRLDHINSLILLAGKSRFLIDQAEANEASRQNLSAEVYTWVVGNFSDELYAAYLAQRRSNATPQDLNLAIDFLYEQLISVYVEQNTRRVEVPRADLELADMMEVPPPKKKDHYRTELVGCELCHSTEHLKENCGLLKWILCLKCFSYGHYKENCKRLPLSKDDFII